MNCRLFVFGSTLLIAASSQAIDIYNNFGPGDSYRVGAGSTINSNVSVANPFTVTDEATLDFVRLALFANNTYAVTINQGGATIPGNVVSSWTVTGGGIKTLVADNPLTLAAGNYYLVVKHVSGSGGAWNGNSINDIGPYSFTNTANVWEAGAGERPVYQIAANPVPEPTTLIALGGLVAAFARRKKK